MSFNNNFFWGGGCEFDASLQVLLKIFLKDDMSAESENFGFMVSNIEIQFCQISPKASRYGCCGMSCR
jgi:hypothetical protein